MAVGWSGRRAGTKFACGDAASFGETAKGGVAALGACENAAGEVAAVLVLLGPDW
jgi:hypothetical protein